MEMALAVTGPIVTGPIVGAVLHFFLCLKRLRLTGITAKHVYFVKSVSLNWTAGATISNHSTASAEKKKSSWII